MAARLKVGDRGHLSPPVLCLDVVCCKAGGGEKWVERGKVVKSFHK